METDDPAFGIDIETALTASRIRSARPGRARCCVRSREIVGCAEAFFRRHLDEPISIAQLSLTARVSERRLRDAFHDVYRTSPKRFLRRWRLHQVRRALRSADSAVTSVTDAATRHGFSELGRFSVDYRTLFGELPSHTLCTARAQHRSRVRAA